MLHRILERAERLSDTGVTVKEAADALAVSQPTIRSWIEHGILDRAAGSGPTRVTAASLGAVVAAARTIRQAGTSKRLMTELIHALEDRHTMATIEDRLGDVRRGDVVEVDPDRLAALFG
jgi:hypothetical protein